jgi:ATP-dependent Zn protease
MGNARNFAFWIVLFFLMIVLFSLFSNGQPGQTGRTLSYSEFLTRVEAGDVSRVLIDGEQLRVTDRSGQVTPPSARRARTRPSVCWRRTSRSRRARRSGRA